jgi:hypothetical protein
MMAEEFGIVVIIGVGIVLFWLIPDYFDNS